jgi:hypothetical protein
VNAAIKIGTILFWAVGLGGEYAIQRWPTRKKLLNVIAAIAFGLALLGEYASYKLDVIQQSSLQAEISAQGLQLADRHITPEQRTRMLDVLRGGTGRVAVTYLTSSAPDSQEYSIEVGGVFRDADWTVVPHPWLTTMDVPVHGFAVTVRGKDDPASKRKPLETVTRNALSVLDDRIVVTYGGTDPGPGMNLDLVVLVGGK